MGVVVTTTDPQTTLPVVTHYVYVYRVSDRGQSHLVARLHASAGDPGAFAASFALDGGTLVIGSAGGASSNSPPATAGTANVYERHGDNWILKQTLAAAEAGPNSDFGAAVAVRGDTILVGAPFEDPVPSGFGTAAEQVEYGPSFLYRRDSGQLVLDRQILAQEPGSPATSLDLSRHYLIVGSNEFKTSPLDLASIVDLDSP
jgi:hypothetical protein